MRSLFTGLLVIGSLFGSLASAEVEFAGDVSGSLENLNCTVQGNEFVSVVSKIRKDHYVVGMTVKGVWYDDKNVRHFADFEVVVMNANYEAQTLQVIGVSPGKNALEVKVNLETQESEMYINGRNQNLKLVCDSPIAG
jgi:NADH:ubiquinone oxidoreductase subunit C